MSNKLIVKIGLFLIGTLFLVGGACPSNDTVVSNKVAQSEIYQSYSVAQNGEDYDVTAYFRVGGKTGTTLALSAPSTITFNGQSMKENLNTTSGTYYTARVPATTANGTFAFTDRGGKTYTNKIELNRVALNPAKIRADGVAPVALGLSAVPPSTATLSLQLNNRLVFVVDGPGEMTEAYYDKSQNSLMLLPAAWKAVAPGNVTVDLEVRNSLSTTEGTALGGEISFAYDAPAIQVAFAKGKTNNAVANKKSATAKK